MDKAVLKQYQDLKMEVRETERRIEQLREQLDRIEREGMVTDIVKGGEGGIQHFKITGFPQSEYSHVKSLLQAREIRLTGLMNRCMDSVNEVEEFIASVDDSHIRRILTYRVIEDLTWVQVAHRIGGGNTEESVRKACERYIENLKN